ncbi:phage late control D family protein [Citrobacter portucalensis]|uniref:phage late control D family protein n=1 Tax=Citrobacter portucalensis TaxID=1639133 RepID=UPI00226B3D1B|nr:phage late control D family protein [Citrobacter portucalensis]MCX9039106.1 phage late control D family protein [Citrobacter portucalensis]
MTDFIFVNGWSLVPAIQVIIDDKDITTVLSQRLISLTHTDNRGFEADQLDLELDDSDGMLQLPRRGAVLSVAFGWQGQPLFSKGRFIVDEIEHSGAPDRMTIRGRSADFRDSLNIKRERSWHDTTVGAIVSDMAVRNKLQAAIGDDMTAQPIDHMDQTNESDAAFLMRLASTVGAIASVKNGCLLFIRPGQGKTASGKPLPVITLTRSSGDQHRFSIADRQSYTGVVANWLHTREPKKKELVKVRRRRRAKTTTTKAPEAKQGDYLIGTDENVLQLSHTYSNRANAERAAKANWSRIQRGVASFSLQLEKGRADLFPEMPAQVSGFKPEIDEAEWIITTVTNTIGDGGFTTSLELEVRLSDDEIV